MGGGGNQLSRVLLVVLGLKIHPPLFFAADSSVEVNKSNYRLRRFLLRLILTRRCLRSHFRQNGCY